VRHAAATWIAPASSIAAAGFQQFGDRTTLAFDQTVGAGGGDGSGSAERSGTASRSGVRLGAGVAGGTGGAELGSGVPIDGSGSATSGDRDAADGSGTAAGSATAGVLPQADAMTATHRSRNTARGGLKAFMSFRVLAGGRPCGRPVDSTPVHRACDGSVGQATGGLVNQPFHVDSARPVVTSLPLRTSGSRSSEKSGATPPVRSAACAGRRTRSGSAAP
jgi:hypothetical protein